MKRTHIVNRHLPKRFFGAERHVRVRMRAIDELHEGAIGDRGRHVADLDESRQPQLPEPVEVRFRQPRPDDAVGHQGERLAAETREACHGQHGRVRRDIGIEMRTDAGKCRVDVDGRLLAAALVQHVRRNGGEALIALEIGGRSRRQHQHERQHRQATMLRGPQRKLIVQALLGNGGKSDRRTYADGGQPRAVDRDHDTTASVDPSSARCAFPRGTTLSATRLSRRRCSAAAL